MSSAYREFEFDLPEALLARLIDCLDSLDASPLTLQNLEVVPEVQGVYQLFYKDEIVYIGKTDSEAGLRKRLQKHSRTILHRENLTPEHVSFRAVRIYVFTALDLESQLIRHYIRRGVTTWNNSGFGNNDPGRNRDKTRLKPKHFDAMFPIDIDRPLELDLTKHTTAGSAARALRDAVPYTFRFEAESRTKAHPDIEAAPFASHGGIYTARGAMLEIARALPRGWQATALRGRLLLYRESNTYPDAEIIWPT